jgi:hypothetical protein
LIVAIVSLTIVVFAICTHSLFGLGVCTAGIGRKGFAITGAACRRAVKVADQISVTAEQKWINQNGQLTDGVVSHACVRAIIVCKLDALEAL